MQRVVDGSKAHRPYAREQRHLAAFHDAHVVDVFAVTRVIHRVECCDDAAHRFRKRAVEEDVAVVRQQAIHVQRFPRDIDVGRVAAALFVRIARRVERAFVGMCGLDDETVALFKLVRPILADFIDDAAEFVPYDRGICRDIVRHALVRRTLLKRLVAAHAKAV